MIFVVEHMEPELFEWCIIEYEQISQYVGKKNLYFTNITNEKEQKILSAFGTVFSKSISDLEFKNICVLDANAKKQLSADDKNHFDGFVFGGILGDDPPQKRTEHLLKTLRTKNINFQTRNLGVVQMSTDTAVHVAKQILDGIPFETLQFSDGIEIELSESESVQLPYRYLLVNGKPRLSSQLVRYLRQKKTV